MITTLTKTKKPALQITDCGITDYSKTLTLQKQLHTQRLENKIPNTVIILEHNPVITLGVRESANKLLTTPEKLKQKNIELVQTHRAGGITAHNPGQLIFYPIINLKDFNLGITEYIRTLEQIGIEFLAKLNIKAERKKGFPGLWGNEKKIASIGVRVSKSITYHGMAINIQNDLAIFDNFVPCGIDGIEVTSAQKLTDKKYSISEIKKNLSELLIKHFAATNKPQTIINKQPGLPSWLHRPAPVGETYRQTEAILKSLNLETICNNANCPNRGQCWNKGTAAILILGNICTRNCKFCSVPAGKPKPPDTAEPDRIAQMAKQLNLKYLVITSVDRDDLPDGGATHFRDCIKKTRQQCPDIKFEILTPDFRHCRQKAVNILADAMPFVFAHNLETVPSLYASVKAGSDYQLSLNLLKTVKQTYTSIQTKSSIMLGLGETDNQVVQLLKDLRNVGCNRITIGQYLKPSKNALDVVEYIQPEKFELWKQKAAELGFSWIISSPFARSSYFAEQNVL